ncbi:hypothetical protein FS749_003739 [Ceratobasidium sp. UAMH 11750]|nr:hypothetical protein FS749_003739 [Ceratobasidium sp. UAMH 11750]
MPHLRLGSELDIPHELLDTQLRDEWASLKALGDSVRQNLRLRPLDAIDDDDEADRPDFLSPTAPAHHVSAPSFAALGSAPSKARPAPQPLDLAGVLARSDALRIDTRSPEAFAELHVPGSVNLFFLSLKLKRLCKPGALASIAGLYPYITSDTGRATWDNVMTRWDGSVIVYEHEMEAGENAQRSSPAAPGSSTAWSLLAIISQLPECRSTYYLAGGLSAVATDPRLVRTSTEPADLVPTLMKKSSNSALGGRFELLTSSPDSTNQSLPELDATDQGNRKDSSSSSLQSGYLSPPVRTLSPGSPSRSPRPVVSPSRSPSLTDNSPSPSPSAASFPSRPRVGAPKLKRLDTKSAERLSPGLVIDSAMDRSPPPPPKLQLHTATARPTAVRAATMPLRPLNLHPPTSPSYMSTSPTSPGFPRSSPPRSPVPPTPGTVRAFPSALPTPTPGHASSPNEFEVSTILPGFLYLGPEPTTMRHVQELQRLGVKRIVSVAIECDDDQGLDLRGKFEKYFRIPMRDTVEEENVGRGAHDVCAFLDDARLHSSPTYVHCKAGKSRSVTMVMAFLIHANHWPLWRAYQFVLERRREISPNIGFVSELMNFEERELGTKSLGVLSEHDDLPTDMPGAGGMPTGKAGNFGHLANARRGGQLRESLPPVFSMPQQPDDLGTGAEVEVRDSTGRYRHARRAPVDESTLQPGRRVSKAGLEGTW